VVYVILLYYIRRATCFDCSESSSGPQGSDPYNKWDNALSHLLYGSDPWGPEDDSVQSKHVALLM
jgi:hypothetical protein